ncbi:Dam family site-specific DNA-(adenine-N6)-methyltransferase [Clostridium sartagoforme]|uniref:Site-specific DNA-methyltransferase (adenine-specific) n=1 Tax=Clostridium sartagoforme TaxID=84031 RepID=A0A4S2DPM3_9CLOT|nr:Dam family site-specific DNA-(adenine-N6)-methyltransferase [Clostridium sartagoforme]TGY44105.1 Dam family site-specific DNA-(adenine-N6)-methyltransferase [Clostridium sartagoforme]
MKKNLISSPFLRWAGGKKWLIGFVEDLIKDKKINDYIEPFLGGGAIFFSLNGNHNSILSDINEDLITAYKIVKSNPNELLTLLLSYENTKEFYYNIRNSSPNSEIEKAARFIYLNQTSFNGLYRVNRSGEYNVPYGNRKNVNFSREKLINASTTLKNAKLIQGDFTETIDYIKEGDLVFLDPPYTVSHNNNGFIEYNKNLFSIEDQYRLSDFIDKIKLKGAYYILTNAAHDTIKEIFAKDDVIYELERNSLIGGKNSKRGIIKEYVFTNITNEVSK